MVLVAREGGRVEDFLAAARHGPRALVIEGEPGIGKTTAWRSACQAATGAGFRVLSCRPAPAEVSLSYAVLADLFADVDSDLLDTLPHVQRTAIDALLLRGSAHPAAADERVVGTAVRSAIEQLARRTPVLLAVDDVQWLDASSRVVLGFVARRLPDKVGILATARVAPQNFGAASWLQLPREDQLQRIRLQPMTIGALSAIVSERLGVALPRPAMVRVTEISGGNPFYAIELARVIRDDNHDLRTSLPGSLTAVVRSRIAHVSDDTRHVLLAAAATSDPTFELLAAACELSSDEVIALLADAERTGIVAIDGHRVRFTHPLLSTGVYADAPVSARRTIHRRLAEHVDHTELRARHLAMATHSSDSATLDALDTAAEETRARGAPAAGAELIDLAIKLGGDTPVRRLRAAEQHFRSGALIEARIHLDHVLPSVPSGTLKCVALMLQAAVDGHDDDLGTAVNALTAAVEEAGEPALRLQAMLLLPAAEFLVGDHAEAVANAANAVALADQLGVAAWRSQALSNWLFMSCLHGMGVDQDALDTALDTRDPAGSASMTADAKAVAAVIAGWEGRLHEARPAMATVVQRFKDGGTEVDILATVVFLSTIDLWMGRYADAAEAADDALQRARAMGGELFLAEALSAVAAVEAHTGHVDDARGSARAAVAAADRCGSWYLAIAPLTWLGFIEVSLGDHAAALDAMAPLLARFDAHHGTEIAVGGYLPNAVEALCALGRVEEAAPLVDALHANGTRLDRAWMLAVAARGRAMCLAATGDVVGALTAAEEALVHHDRIPMPFERARTLLLLGQLQRRARQKSVAAATLEQALMSFTTLGAPLWAARADAERKRVRVGASGATTLAPTEARIAELAAEGLTNRDIAAQLFVSVKTVEANMTRIFRKLEVRSRTELVRRLNSANEESAS